MDHAAIRDHHHRGAGHPNPADNEGVCRVLGFTRPAAKGHTTKQAAALTAGALGAMRATAHLPCTGHWTVGQRARTARRRRRVGMALISVLRDASFDAPRPSRSSGPMWSATTTGRRGSSCAARRAT